MDKNQVEKVFKSVFGTSEGKDVLEHLREMSGIDDLSKFRENERYTYYKSGRASLFADIEEIINKEKNVRRKH